jgi:hypothetical protein
MPTWMKAVGLLWPVGAMLLMVIIVVVMEWLMHGRAMTERVESGDE